MSDDQQRRRSEAAARARLRRLDREQDEAAVRRYVAALEDLEIESEAMATVAAELLQAHERARDLPGLDDVNRAHMQRSVDLLQTKLDVYRAGG